MNGRIYDPLLGRFLSADRKIPKPLNLQSYNRYTYVLNNPLSYTDPTGYDEVMIMGRMNAMGMHQLEQHLKKKYDTDRDVQKIVADVEVIQEAGDRGGLIGSGLVIGGVLSYVYFPQMVAIVTELLGEDSPHEDRVEEQEPQTGSDEGKVSPQTPPNTEDSEDQRYREYWEQDYSDPDNQTRQRDQAPPGTPSITDQKKSHDSDEVYERETIYDEYGRRVENNDYTDHGRPKDHTNPHHHRNAPIGPHNKGEHGRPQPGPHPDTPPPRPPETSRPWWKFW